MSSVNALTISFFFKTNLFKSNKIKFINEKKNKDSPPQHIHFHTNVYVVKDPVDFLINKQFHILDHKFP